MDLFGIFGKKEEGSKEQKPSGFDQNNSVKDRLYAQEKLIEKSESYCDLMYTLIEKDVLSVRTYIRKQHGGLALNGDRDGVLGKREAESSG
eukprot:762890-Hanusia_phi.AAC.10